MHGRVLIVAGSDSGGGAGLQADVKTVMALGGYGMTAVTALTVQDTEAVREVFPVPAAFVARQMLCALRDPGADAVKTGMLGDAATVEAVAAVIAAHPGLPFVLDPVMAAKGGHALLAPDAVACLKRVLVPLACVITPNAPEAEILAGVAIRDVNSMRHAAESLLTLGVAAVLIKGGHLEGDECVDVLATVDGVECFAAPRQATRHTHGTGCTLASAIATGLAQGVGLSDAVRRAHDYVRRAIEAAPGIGAGHGPLDHLAPVLEGLPSG